MSVVGFDHGLSSHSDQHSETRTVGECPHLNPGSWMSISSMCHSKPQVVHCRAYLWMWAFAFRSQQFQTTEDRRDFTFGKLASSLNVWRVRLDSCHDLIATIQVDSLFGTRSEALTTAGRNWAASFEQLRCGSGKSKQNRHLGKERCDDDKSAGTVWTRLAADAIRPWSIQQTTEENSGA